MPRERDRVAGNGDARRLTGREHAEDPREYLATVVLGSHLERLPPERRDAFADAVLAAMPEPAIEYVRLNLVAQRPR